MVEVQELAEGLIFEQSLPDFDDLRRRVEEHLTAGSLDRARLVMEEARDCEDDIRSGEENTWLYGHLGKVYRAEGKKEKALAALERALDREPRSLLVERELSELLMDMKEYERGLEVTRLLLLNHKSDLPAEEIAAIYRRIGALNEGQGEFQKARQAYEKSLQKEPESAQALTGLLRVVGEIGEPGDVVNARLKLIRSLDDARARSAALVALAGDWVQKFNDSGRALDTLEEALSEWPENREAVERMAQVSAELGDWRRVSRSYFTLSLLSEGPSEKAEFLIRSSDVARQELWEAEKALAGYRRALELDPTRLDAFKAVTSILVDARDWESLETAYLQLISVNQENEDAPAELLAVLWEKLADLYSEHLGQIDEALIAYEQSIRFAKQRPEVRLRIVELAEEREGMLDLAAEKLRELVELEPQKGEWLERLGRVHLRQKKVDAAYCVFRALRAKGVELDPKAAGFLGRFDTGVVKPLRGQINPSIMKRFIFAEELSPYLNDVFTLLKPALEEWTGETRRKYGLRRKDRVDLAKSELGFVSFYKQVGAALGYVELPDLWVKEDQVGLMNGALIPAGLIVGQSMLQSSREKHIAFHVGKQLFRFLSPFYLATIRPVSNLDAFSKLAKAWAEPEEASLEGYRKEPAYKSVKKAIRGDELTHLRECLKRLGGEVSEKELDRWVEGIEDTSNRVGLLFCDDLKVCEEALRQEQYYLGTRSVADRMRKLIDYSISEKYLSLRPQLGIEVA